MRVAGFWVWSYRVKDRIKVEMRLRMCGDEVFCVEYITLGLLANSAQGKKNCDPRVFSGHPSASRMRLRLFLVSSHKALGISLFFFSGPHRLLCGDFLYGDFR